MYPNEVDTFPTRLKGETIEADHINLLQNAVTAIETTLDERSPSSSAVVPDMDYTPGADNTAAILTARAVAVSRNVPLLIPRGPHPWVMTDNLTLWDGARLILKGTLDIQTDHSAGGLGIIGTSVEDVVIDGGGTLSQSNAAARNGVYGSALRQRDRDRRRLHERLGKPQWRHHGCGWRRMDSYRRRRRVMALPMHWRVGVDRRAVSWPT